MSFKPLNKMHIAIDLKPRRQILTRQRREDIAVLLTFLLVSGVGGYWLVTHPPVEHLQTARPGVCRQLIEMAETRSESLMVFTTRPASSSITCFEELHRGR